MLFNPFIGRQIGDDSPHSIKGSSRPNCQKKKTSLGCERLCIRAAPRFSLSSAPFSNMPSQSLVPPSPSSVGDNSDEEEDQSYLDFIAFLNSPSPGRISESSKSLGRRPKKLPSKKSKRGSKIASTIRSPLKWVKRRGGKISRQFLKQSLATITTARGRSSDTNNISCRGIADDALAAHESHAVSMQAADENRIKFNKALDEAFNRRERGEKCVSKMGSTQLVDEFIKLPTNDRWNDLVESVRREREPIPEVPSLSGSLIDFPFEGQDISDGHNNVMPRMNSSHSISSICSETAEACMPDLDDDDVQEVSQIATSNTEDAADSTLVWGALGMILGSPAPKSVLGEKKLKKRSPVNLWEDDEGCLSIPSVDSDSDDDSFVSAQSVIERMDKPPTLLVDKPPPTLLKPRKSKFLSHEDDEMMLQIEAMAREADVAFESRRQRSLSKAGEGEVTDNAHEQEDCQVMPSIDLTELVDAKYSNVEGPAKNEGCGKEAADSVLAWSALGVLLGSPAPRTVSTKRRKCPPMNLWDDGNSTEDDLDGLLSVSNGNEDEDDSMPSLAGISADEEDPSNLTYPQLLEWWDNRF